MTSPTASPMFSPTASPSRLRRCRQCSKCKSLARRVQRMETEYDYLRHYFLRPVRLPLQPFNRVTKEDRAICEEIEQLKITLDTLVRSQLFELSDD